ncbi:MAG: IS5 family transposase [Steroidobacteraceae bacterium]|nr:IS5 family transposase [Steroidobacteraceae bacterium]
MSARRTIAFRTGCAWRYLPREYPPWATAYGYFRQWRLSGVWQRINDRLRALVRQAAGRESQPSAAILDSQSVKTTARGGPARGFDAGKQIAGRKRHLLVDVLGLVMVAVVHAASVQDYDGARVVFERVRHRFSRLRLIWADSAYARKGLPGWVRALRERRKLHLEVVKRQPEQKGFVVQPRRWVVERTFAWLGFHRRLSKDYEALPETSEALIYVAMIRLMLARLA